MAGKLIEARVKRLKSIGFVFYLKKQISDEMWDERYEELVAYKAKYGHTEIPTKTRVPELKPLAKWVLKQRIVAKKNELNEDRMKRLKKLGFTFGVKEKYWDIRYQELKEYKEAFGDCELCVYFGLLLLSY